MIDVEGTKGKSRLSVGRQLSDEDMYGYIGNCEMSVVLDIWRFHVRIPLGSSQNVRVLRRGDLLAAFSNHL